MDLLCVEVRLSRSVCPPPPGGDPLSAADPLPIPLHAEPGVPALRQAARLSRGREHARQGEEAAQSGRLAGQQPAAEPRLPESGE